MMKSSISLTALSLIFALLFLNTISYAAVEEGATSPDDRERITANLGIKAGYRIDRLNWNIARDFLGSEPNILSELRWEDLEIFQVQFQPSLSAAGSRNSGLRYHLRGLFGWGDIFSGSNQDSDYAGNNRTLEFSRSNNAADEGDVFDLSVAAGLEFSGRGDDWTIIPLIGYSYHEQNLQITDGYQTVTEQMIADDFFGTGAINLPPLGPIPALGSRYHSEWYGPWLGLEVIFQPGVRWRFGGTLDYHLVEYFGEADWNLREDLQHPVSFRHWAEGDGVSFAVKTDLKLSQRWSGNLTAKYQKWQADDGTDAVYLVDGTISGTRFNEVNWKSTSLMVGISRRF